MGGAARTSLDELAPLDTYLALSDRERGLDPRELERLAGIVRIAAVRDGARVLDAGAGQGWHALALARRFRVTGVDVSLELVEEGRRRARAVPPRWRPRLVAAPVQRVPAADESFDVALSLNTSIGYGSPEDDAAAVEELRRVLRPGAALVLETISATAASEARARRDSLADGTRLTRIPVFDSATAIIGETQLACFPDGRRGLFGYRVRAYDPDGLVELAREAGFRDITVDADTPGRQSENGGRVVLVARTPV
jgi:SAM-dependent methyltransferase